MNKNINYEQENIKLLEENGFHVILGRNDTEILEIIDDVCKIDREIKFAGIRIDDLEIENRLFTREFDNYRLFFGRHIIYSLNYLVVIKPTNIVFGNCDIVWDAVFDIWVILLVCERLGWSFIVYDKRFIFVYKFVKQIERIYARKFIHCYRFHRYNSHFCRKVCSPRRRREIFSWLLV